MKSTFEIFNDSVSKQTDLSIFYTEIRRKIQTTETPWYYTEERLQRYGQDDWGNLSDFPATVGLSLALISSMRAFSERDDLDYQTENAKSSSSTVPSQIWPSISPLEVIVLYMQKYTY